MEKTSEELLNDAFEIMWKRYLEKHTLPIDAWVKELARTFFKREIENE